MHRQWQMHLWNLNQPPAGSNLWVFKITTFRSIGDFYSLQLPSGITLRLLIKGSGVVRVGDQEWKTVPGDFFCAIPGVLIEMYDNEDDPWHWLEWQVTGSGAMGYITAIGLKPDQPVRHASNPECAAETYNKLYNEFVNENRNPYLAISYTYTLCQNCNNEQEHAQTSSDHRSSIVSDAIAFYEAHQSTEININSLAESIGVNRTTLLRAFRQTLNMSPLEYLQRQRMIKASELLSLTDLPLKTIARSIGFRNEKYFSRCFDQNYGVPPGIWRKQRMANPLGKEVDTATKKR